MNLKSGISKELKRQFIVDENSLIRIKGVLDKSAESLEKPAQVVFHVEREDDRFYETTKLDDVISDPNISGKKITLVGLEIREDQLDKESRRDWIARVIFLAERKLGAKFKETNEIHIEISTNDKVWALLLADELEPQIERTINRSKMPRWPLVGLGAFGVYGFIKLYFFVKEKLPIDQIETFKPVIATVLFIPFLYSLWIFVFSGIMGNQNWLIKLIGPESVFLWGEEEKRFNEREQTRKNLFWAVMVAFVVSALASVAVTMV